MTETATWTKTEIRARDWKRFTGPSSWLLPVFRIPAAAVSLSGSKFMHGVVLFFSKSEEMTVSNCSERELYAAWTTQNMFGMYLSKIIFRTLRKFGNHFYKVMGLFSRSRSFTTEPTTRTTTHLAIYITREIGVDGRHPPAIHADPHSYHPKDHSTYTSLDLNHFSLT